MRHEVEFTALLAEVNAAAKLRMLSSRSLRYANHAYFRIYPEKWQGVDRRA